MKSLIVDKVIPVIAAVGLWQIAFFAGGQHSVIPSPVATVLALWSARFDYFPHVIATLSSATCGFIGGTVVALLLASIIALVPQLEVLLGPCTFLFSTPLIVIVPLIALAASPETTPALCAGLLVYYPILLLTLTGMRNLDATLLAFATSAGGTRWTIFRALRIHYAITGFLGGVQSALPVAILGAMLGELTGARWGLGSYLLAIIAQGSQRQEWAIFLFCSGLTALLYWLATVALQNRAVQLGDARTRSDLFSRPYQLMASVVVTLAVWQVTVAAIRSPYFFKGPYDVLKFASQMTHGEISTFIDSLGETVQTLAVGLVVGIATGFLLAIGLHIYRFLRWPVMACTFVSQSVPIVALIPLYVSVFGRSIWTTLAITISATFFLSFTGIYEGLNRTPTSLLMVAHAAGASDWQALWKVKLPAAIPFVFAAARLSAPRVFLGVTLSEYLATRRGLGALLFEARGKLDFGMMWMIATCAGVVSLVLIESISYFEQRSVRRFRSGSTMGGVGVL